MLFIVRDAIDFFRIGVFFMDLSYSCTNNTFFQHLIFPLKSSSGILLIIPNIRMLIKTLASGPTFDEGCGGLKITRGNQLVND